MTVNNLNFSSKDNIITASSDTLHSFSNNDFVEISGITSSSYFGIQGIQQIGVTTATSFVSVAIGNTSDTGITTSINLDTPVNSSTFKINDIIQVDNEKLLIIGLDRVNNKYVVSECMIIQQEELTLLIVQLPDWKDHLPLKFLVKNKRYECK